MYKRAISTLFKARPFAKRRTFTPLQAKLEWKAILKALAKPNKP